MIKRINNADSFSQPSLIIFTKGADIFGHDCTYIYNNVCRTYLFQMDVFVNDSLVPLWVLSLLNILYPSLVLSTVRLLYGDRIQGAITLDYGFQM